MMFFWINLALWILIIFLTALIFSMAFEPRYTRISRWNLSWIFVGLILPFAYIKIANSGHILEKIMFWLQIVITVIYLLIAFKDKLKIKILFFALWLIISYVGDIICTSLMRYMGLTFDTSFNQPEMVLFVAIDVLLVTILSVLLLISWNRVFKRMKVSRTIWLFFVFPMSQLIMLYFINDQFYIKAIHNNAYVCVGVLLGFAADYILLYVLMGQGEKEEIAKRLLELERLYQLENVHYQAIEARRNEMAKLRHDFNNQLLTICHMMEQGAANVSRELLGSLQEEIANTKEYAYCGNPVVNAVIDEKGKVCREKNIRLEVSLELEEESYIQSIHMCSIFTNLIDNAMSAAADCSEGSRFIRIKAARKEDYLHIKVENSSLTPKKRLTSERKSYGQEILRDIASRYHGEFQAGWKDGVYSSMLSLTAE